MKQTPFTTDKGEFRGIDLPEGATNVQLYVGILSYDLAGNTKYLQIPFDNWQIITPNASEATEEQAREIVPYIESVYHHSYSRALIYMIEKVFWLTGTVTVLKKVK
jgi:hypothetical protein